MATAPYAYADDPADPASETSIADPALEGADDGIAMDSVAGEPDSAGDSASTPPVANEPVELQVDKEALLAAIDEARGITDLSPYTDESQTALSAAFKAAESARDNSEISQAQVDSAQLTLVAAISGLRERPFELPAFALPALIAAAVLVVAAVVVALVLRRRKGGQKGLQGPAASGVDLPPVPRSQSTNQLAGAKSPSSGQLTFGDRQHKTQEYRQQFRSEAGSNHSLTIVLDEDGGAGAATSVISSVRPSDTAATLKRLRTGESTRIGTAGATVGKDASRATFVINGNSTISRRHARVHADNGRFYLSDLNATNGTYVNGQRLAPNEAVPLSSGDTITLSDEQFLFEITSDSSGGWGGT
jgi:hypothetical protein